MQKRGVEVAPNSLGRKCFDAPKYSLLCREAAHLSNLQSEHECHLAARAAHRQKASRSEIQFTSCFCETNSLLLGTFAY